MESEHASKLREENKERGLSTRTFFTFSRSLFL